jgi:nucleotide-binding universal stress UspA family protein
MAQNSPRDRFAYSSIMVHVDLGSATQGRVDLASKLASRFGSRLIGVGAEEPFVAYDGAMMSVVSSHIEEDEQRRVADDLAKAEALFRARATNSIIVEWRGGEHPTTPFLLEQARAADLVIVGRQGLDDDADWRLGVSPGDVVMGLGRPMLLVPPAVSELEASRVIVAWKDTREARRAVWDSLPFLLDAKAVFVVSAGDGTAARACEDVAAFINQHAGTKNRQGAERARAVNTASQASVVAHLLEVADGEGADLIVAGAYGHSRVREWVLGGVTRELLETTPACCLLAH